MQSFKAFIYGEHLRLTCSSAMQLYATINTTKNNNETKPCKDSKFVGVL